MKKKIKPKTLQDNHLFLSNYLSGIFKQKSSPVLIFLFNMQYVFDFNFRTTIHQCLNQILAKERDFDLFLVEQKKALCETLKKELRQDEVCDFRKLIDFVHGSIILGMKKYF